MGDQIQKDSRQVPKTQDYVAVPKYSDLLYGWLQTHSYWDNVEGHPRYLWRSAIKFNRIAEDIGYTRQTVSKRFKVLIDMGLVVEEEDRYVLTVLDRKYAALIPIETLIFLGNTVQEKVISVFANLYSRYYAASQIGEEAIFTIEQLKLFAGLGAKGHGNDYIIQDILLILTKLGLLNAELRWSKRQDGQLVSRYYIVEMHNTIPELTDDVKSVLKVGV